MLDNKINVDLQGTTTGFIRLSVIPQRATDVSFLTNGLVHILIGLYRIIDIKSYFDLVSTVFPALRLFENLSEAIADIGIQWFRVGVSMVKCVFISKLQLH